MQTEKKMPKGINKSSDKKRFIKIRIDTTKIKKEWITFGAKGSYLDMTLQLLPNGEVDRYENLGMITQDVPSHVYKEDKTSKGDILGNARELDWSGDNESVPGAAIPETPGDIDDLPF